MSSAEIDANIDAWQIGSAGPPSMCLCCGSKFDEEKHKIRGPYLEMPYIWVCQWCWEKPYLFFPDKVFNRNIEVKNTEESLPKRRGTSGTLDFSIVPERTLSTELAYVKVRDLRLDPKNPRFRHLGTFGNEKEMESALWKQPSTRTLYHEIEYSQGLSTPLLIDSNKVVREGNRRLVCLRHLIARIMEGESDVPLTKIQEVPCFILPPGAKEEDIAVYLTLEHITGKKEWRPINQAAHVYDLHNVHRIDFRRIADIIGRSQSYLRAMEKAYGATLEYHNLYPEDDGWMSKYSYFFEVYRHRRTTEWIGAKGNLRRLSKWIHNGKISKGAEIRKLDLIIGNTAVNDSKSSDDQDDADRRLISLMNQTQSILAKHSSLKANGELTPDALETIESLNLKLTKFLDDAKKEKAMRKKR